MSFVNEDFKGIKLNIDYVLGLGSEFRIMYIMSYRYYNLSNVALYCFFY